MTINRVPRVLYFHAGNNPTDEQREDARRFGPNVGFRTSDQVSALAMSPLEECDAVAGDVPARYAAVYPEVTGMDPGERLIRMSDVDRRHGAVTEIDNEAARAGKPPTVGGDVIVSQGAVRPAGAMTAAGGGFVAPVPGNPDNLRSFGSERAENGTEGTNREGVQGSRVNPHGLSDAGASLPKTGTDPNAVTGPKAEGGGQGGFRAPEPVTPETEDEGDEGDTSGKRKGKAKAGDAA